MIRTTKNHSQKYQVSGLRFEGDLKHAKRRASYYHRNIRFEANKNIGLFVTCLIPCLKEVNTSYVTTLETRNTVKRALFQEGVSRLYA
jgi:hypothetical protein